MPPRAREHSRPLPPPVGSETQPPATVFKSDAWIIQYHDAWSKLTLSSFYQDVEEHSLTSTQFARWLLDRASVSIAVIEAATRISLTLQARTGMSELPLLRTAKENAQFLAEYTTLNGLDINSEFRLSHPAKRFVDLLEASTAPDASHVVAITAVWGFMFSSWQGWALCRLRGKKIPENFAPVADYISRSDAVTALVDTQQILDGLLNEQSSMQDYEKAGKTFEEIMRRSSAMLEHTLYMGAGNQVPICICGRKGHMPSQCTFKSHI